MKIILFLFCLKCLLIRVVYLISPHPLVIVLAFDGFRFDYSNPQLTPNLEHMRNDGVKVEYLQNVFPTKTYVNFFTISTGTYPETHGILGNTVFNNGQCLQDSYEMYHYNPDIIPIWTLNELSGDGRHSGTFWWAAGEYPFKNITPTFSESYPNYTIAGDTLWENRIDTVMKWLTDEHKPVNLLMMYFEQPDSASHQYGILTSQLTEQIRKVDNILDYFNRKLEDNGLAQKANVIVLSDHGMVQVDRQKNVLLDDIIDNKYYSKCGTSPVFQIIPKAGYEDIIYKNLTDARERLKSFSVYKRDEIPNRWHYKNNNRVTSTMLLVVADIPNGIDETNLGDHGYDNELPLMRAFFATTGPAFRKNVHVKSLSNVDIFALITYVLRLDTSLLTVKPNSTLHDISTILTERTICNTRDTRTRDILSYFLPRNDPIPSQQFVTL